jgi:hypothetical protein
MHILDCEDDRKRLLVTIAAAAPLHRSVAASEQT